MPNTTDIIKEIEGLEEPEREELFFRLFGPMEPFFPFPPFRWHRRSIGLMQFPSVVKTPNVCGGVPRIIRTRIPVWTLERMRQLGVSEANILRSYPSLRAVDLVQAWGFADQFRDEIEKQIRENEEEYQ